MRLMERMKELDSGMEERVGAKRSSTVRMTGAVCTANFLLGTGKLLRGIFSASFFTMVNALYTYGIVAAKLCALKGIAVPVKKQYTCYRGAAGILGLCMGGCSALLGGYMLWRVRKPELKEENA